MEQRTPINMEPYRIYVTIGLFYANNEDVMNIIFANRMPIDIAPYTNTARETVSKIRENIAVVVNNSEKYGILVTNPYNLYFMAYKTADPNEKPYLYSDNSPESKRMEKELKEFCRRSHMSVFQRMKEDLTNGLKTIIKRIIKNN